MDALDIQAARSTWSQRLVSYYFVDVGLLAQAIYDAIPLPARLKIKVQDLTAELTSDLAIFPERAGGWYWADGMNEFLGIHLLVRRYGRWMKALGKALGFDVESSLIEDDWLEDNAPEIQAIVWDLMDRVRVELKAAKAISDPHALASAIIATRRSVEAGEQPRQTQIRAARLTQGLRLVR
ncbi:hypothetical protein QEM33_002601 [Pseudomonas putida]|nr:hypothetical protein [Pseudomonas putida]